MSLDLDSSYTGPLVDDWMDHIQEVMKEKSNDKNYLVLQYKAIQKSVIEMAFKIAEQLEITPHSKYMAILLYDEFLYKHFLEVYKTEFAHGPRERQWDKICDKISNEAKLYLLSCFQLACKMDSPCTRIEISEMLKFLQFMDSKTIYTYNMIISAEYKVFKTVGFKMPLNTPLTCIEILLAITNRRDKIDHEIALMLLDIAFLQREELYVRFRQETSGYVKSVKLKKITLLKSNILFLSAAVVACLTFFRNTDELESIVEILAEKSLSRTTDIMTMANILFKMAT